MSLLFMPEGFADIDDLVRRFQVVNFARQLADNQSVVETFLNVLGAGNWGGPKSAGSGMEDGESGLLPRYLSELPRISYFPLSC